MGLRHDALHAILANPILSNLELVREPAIIEWLLIDHLMVIHKIKFEDLVEGSHDLSIQNMACRLADIYAVEAETSNMILVKDGPGLQKPYVADTRRAVSSQPHIIFCKNNLDAIESLAVHMLWTRGICVFLVVGAVAYTESLTQDKVPLVEVSGSWSFPSTRPERYKGVYVVGGQGTESSSEDLLRACAKCSTVEADTLMMELACLLPGEGLKVLCTGDSDLLALLTAHGGSDVLVRLDNKSYFLNREMHESKFPGLLHVGSHRPGRQRKRIRRMLGCKPHRGAVDSRAPVLQDLIDIRDENIDTLLPHVRRQHLNWEQALGDSTVEVLNFLLRYGIRGSLYRLLMISTDPTVVQKLVTELGGRTNLDEACSRLFVESELLTRQAIRLATNYAAGLVPPDSYARFLKLSKSGKYFYWRVRSNVDNKDRCRGLVFMALCGTDFNKTPRGLGIKALTTAALGHIDAFAAWCETHREFLLGEKFPPSARCLDMCNQLAKLTGTRKNSWSIPECRVAILTTKFVLRHWLFKSPDPGPEYGFKIQAKGKIVFDLDTHESEGGLSTVS